MKLKNLMGWLQINYPELNPSMKEANFNFIRCDKLSFIVRKDIDFNQWDEIIDFLDNLEVEILCSDNEWWLENERIEYPHIYISDGVQ